MKSLPESGTPISFHSFPAITQDQLKAYAEASGDFNPIHLDEKVAKGVGLPGVIAHGMLIAALLTERALRFVNDECSLEGYRLVHFQSRFKAMTLLGDSPKVGGTLKEASPEKLVLELQAKNQANELTTLANIQFKRG